MEEQGMSVSFSDIWRKFKILINRFLLFFYYASCILVFQKEYPKYDLKKLKKFFYIGGEVAKTVSHPFQQADIPCLFLVPFNCFQAYMYKNV